MTVLFITLMTLAFSMSSPAQSASGAFTYDSLNRLTCATLDGSRIEYQYDAAGNMLRVWTPYTVTVTKSGAGTGLVLDNRGKLDCGADCSGVYDLNTSVTLSAFPDSGLYFHGWSGACTGTGDCIVSVSGALNVTATFGLVPVDLPPPTNLAAQPGDGQVSLTWTASTGGDVAGYNIYRSILSGTSYVKLNGSLILGTAYTDMTATNGTTWYYVAQAVSGGGLYSEYSDEASATPGPAPGAASALVAAPANASVRLSWIAGAGASGYDIYRGTATGGPYIKVNGSPVAGTTHTDPGLTNGTAYFYVVRSRSAGGVEGPDSNEDSATPQVATVLLVDDDGGTADAAATAWALSRAKRAYELHDVSISGSPAAGTLAGYGCVVWDLGRASSGTLTAPDQSNLSAYLDGGGRLALFGMGLLDDIGASNSFVQSYLHVGSATLDVGAASAAGISGDPISDGITLPLSYPFTDHTDEVNPGASAASFFQNPGADPIAIRYPESGSTVYRTAFAAFPMQAVSGSDAAPNNSVILIGRVLDWLTLPAPPTGLAAEAGNTVVRLTWTPCAGCASYKIYRSSSPNSGFAEVASGFADPTYLDTNLPNGTQVYYRITAIVGSQESLQSASISATPVYTGVPPGIGDLHVFKSGGDLLLQWSPVTTSTGGAPASPTGYEVYMGSTPSFVPDVTGFSNRIGTPVVPPFTHVGAGPGTSSRFYQVTAVDSAGGRNFSSYTGACSLACSASADPISGPAPLTVDFTATVTTDCPGSPSFDWDFGDGTAHSSAQNPSHEYSADGIYAWSVTLGIEGLSCIRAGSVTVSTACTPPSITTQPQSQTIQIGQPVTLTVVASGSPILHYQWYRGTSGDTSTPVGSDSTSFTPSPNLTVTTSFWVRVSNGCAPAADSQTATVSINLASVTLTLPGNVPLTLLRIPAGAFQMGSPDTESGRDSDEGPVHSVTFTNDIFLGETEVTQQQWLAVMGAPMPTTCGSYATGNEYPVYCVSWENVAGAGGFISYINSHLSSQGSPFAGIVRLPSESEWEYSARAGTTNRYSFGDNLACTNACDACTFAAQYMWWCGNAGGNSHQVASLDSNPFGLYDMHGNLRELCQDWYASSYPSEPQIDPTGPTSGTRHVMRGGYLSANSKNCRSAERDSGNDPASSDYATGFRVAATSPMPATCWVNCFPTASPAAGPAPLITHFSANPVSNYCSSLSYLWDFGDGQTSTLQNPSHTYSSIGTFNWSLTVTADGLTCTKTGTVTVNVSSAGLVAYYPLDGDTLDYSGNGNNATAYGGVAPTTDRRGTSGMAYYFDGADDYVQRAGFNFNASNITVSCWALIELPTYYRYPFSVHSYTAGMNEGDRNFSIYLTDKFVGIYTVTDGAAAPSYPMSPLTSEGIWYHVALVKDSSANKLTLYLNGTAYDASNSLGALTFSNGRIEVGAPNCWDNGGGCWTSGIGRDTAKWKGKLDDFRLYTRALSAAEISAIYNQP